MSPCKLATLSVPPDSVSIRRSLPQSPPQGSPGQALLSQEAADTALHCAWQIVDADPVPAQAPRAQEEPPEGLPGLEWEGPAGAPYLSSRMGCATASFRQAMLASATLFSEDRESLVSARRVMKRWMRPSS